MRINAEIFSLKDIAKQDPNNKMIFLCVWEGSLDSLKNYLIARQQYEEFEASIKKRLLEGAAVEEGKYYVRLVPMTDKPSDNPDDYRLDVREAKTI